VQVAVVAVLIVLEELMVLAVQVAVVMGTPIKPRLTVRLEEPTQVVAEVQTTLLVRLVAQVW
jgi:hypothetical protein